MRFPRRSGLLLHLTSLPGDFGIGDLGKPAYAFVDFLKRAGQGLWQVLPLGPTAKGNSPYTSFSAFAGNGIVISLTGLVEDGLLSEADLQDSPSFPPDEVDYEAVWRFKRQLLETAFRNFRADAKSQRRDEFSAFCEANGWWLDEYALFIAISGEFQEIDWSQWDRELVVRDPRAIQHWGERLAFEVEFEKFIQFVFLQQWQRLKAYAHGQGIEIFGDLPIFVAYESADVWMHQDHFCLDPLGKRTVLAGVPPDYFSETGQLWSNPLYRWDAFAATGYAWWVKRLRHAFSLFDIVRIDHFRGFQSYWEVPAAAQTAMDGRWVQGPGGAPFRAAERELGQLRIVAEDLGMITPEVHALRDELGFPGMRVLQFGFDEPGGEYHRPDSFSDHCVVYTGTHDNDTAVGWYRSRASSGQGSAADIDEYLSWRFGGEREQIHWDLIRLAFSSAANTAIVPLQDVLGLGSEARMNTPGQPEGNWKWRYRSEMLTTEVEERLRDLAQCYDRGA